MWSSIERLTLYGTVFCSARMLIGATSTLFIASKGVSLYHLGILKSVQAIIILLVDFPIAYLSDRYGNRIAVRLAALFGASWLLLTAYSTDFYILLLAEASNALSMCLFGNSFTTMLVSNSHGENTEQVLGKFEKQSFLFMALFSLLGSLFPLNSPTPWYIASFFIFLICTLSGLLISVTKTDYSKIQKLNFNQSFSEIKSMLYFTFSSISISRSILSAVILGVFYQIIIQYWQFLLSDLTFLKNNGFFYGVTFFCILLAQSFAGNYIAKQKNEKNILFLILPCFGAVFSILGFLVSKNNNVFPILILIIFFFILRALIIITDASLIDKSDYKFKTMMLSLKSTLTRKFMILFLPLMGWIASRFGAEYLYVFNFLMFALLIINQLYLIKKGVL